MQGVNISKKVRGHGAVKKQGGLGRGRPVCEHIKESEC